MNVLKYSLAWVAYILSVPLRLAYTVILVGMAVVSFPIAILFGVALWASNDSFIDGTFGLWFVALEASRDLWVWLLPNWRNYG